ncbi:MAG: polyprenyl synthetase family protein [Bacteroidetes bacterium]|nr:polyprenyl synthetase family protein [Bacteroidota bacterium]
MNFLKEYTQYKNLINSKLSKTAISGKPELIYSPVKYILNGGGKRMRPILTLLSSQAVGGKKYSAINAALAIEMLHAFTLVHDDIMDNAPTRRGRKTIHTKWNISAAILVGDGIIALSFLELLKTKSNKISEISKVFTKGLIDVCDGQALDKEFETNKNVTIKDYFKMIDLKTGRMVATSTEIGAIIGGGKSSEISALRKFGESLGRAFQIQDDLLDVISNKKTFGKEIGNDITSGKKTFLLLNALKKSTGKDKDLIKSIIKNNGIEKNKIEKVKDIYNRLGIINQSKNEVGKEILKACDKLYSLPKTDARQMLFWFASMLLQRKF